MTRLPFKLPEYSPRITWSSPRAREVWEPRIQRVSAAWLKVERDSVIRGIRPSALQNVSPENLPALMKELAPHGVIALPLGKSPRAQGYQSASRSLADGEPWDYRVAVTRPEYAEDWTQAWERGDDDTIGRLLGTPECCIGFFKRVWKTERWFDTTVPMYHDHVNSHGHVNMFWRWLGVRPVSHLPCSTECEASQALSKRLSTLLPAEERAWMDAILSWPVKYTSLHGIAEITSPIHRMSVPTDALAERVEIRYLGTGYPEEGAQGVDFPHLTNTSKPVPIRLTRPQDPRDNGFSSREAQDAAHASLLRTAPGPFGTIVDLGCGDGTLLSKFPAQRRVGIESNPARARHARLDRVVVGDCTDRALVAKLLDEERPDLVIAQRDRNPPDTLPGHQILSYSYVTGEAPPRLVIP